MLYIVATPIGNLKDITLRALEVLKDVDGIICEDTRRTSTLLNNYQIKKPLWVLNDFNEAKQLPFFLNKLVLGENLALVSDAGTPLIADPGFKLVRGCLETKIEVDSIPGPSSIIDALTLSSLPPHHFLFLNFLPEKSQARLKLLTEVKQKNLPVDPTYIIFVSPYKLVQTLEDFQQIFGDINISLAKELTKLYQSVENKLISQWLELFKKSNPKGEYVLLFNLKEVTEN